MRQRPAIDPAVAALLIALCAAWGAGQVAIKVGNQGISPLYHAAIRSAGTALLVWGWSALRGISLGRRDGMAAYGATIATLFATRVRVHLLGLQRSSSPWPAWRWGSIS